MQRKHSILYPVVGAALLLLSCSEKQVPSSITTVSLEDYRETLDAKEDEIIDITVDDFEDANFRLSGQVTTPLQAGNDFAARTYFPVSLPRDIFKEDVPLHKVMIEGTLTSTLPFFLELNDIVVNPDITCTWDKVLLAPSLANETSSARFTMQLESGKDLKSPWIDATLLFRLFADESCAGKPINESGCISLKDLVVKY